MALDRRRGAVRALPGPSPSRRDRQLLATKLYVPRSPAGFYPRPRLVERLNAGLLADTVEPRPAGGP